jgi:stringent starvation protein B
MSNPPIAPAAAGTSTRPYLIRALHDWCTDNGFTPYIAVFVDAGVRVPMEYVKNNEIVLNVGFEATSGLKLGNETIEFKARFGGSARDIVVPVDHVIAIYARENGQGMAFPAPHAEGGEQPPTPIEPRGEVGRGLRLASSSSDEAPPAPPAIGPRLLTPEPNDAEQPPPPEPPAAPGGTRPSLKRVK